MSKHARFKIYEQLSFVFRLFKSTLILFFQAHREVVKRLTEEFALCTSNFRHAAVHFISAPQNRCKIYYTFEENFPGKLQCNPEFNIERTPLEQFIRLFHCNMLFFTLTPSCVSKPHFLLLTNSYTAH